MSHSQPAESSGEQPIAILGVGLIGGSIAAALKKRRYGGKLIGCGRNQNRLEVARQLGLIDDATTELAQAAAECRLIVVCLPVDLIVQAVRDAAPHCPPDTLITDAGSVKRAICRELADGLPVGVCFIGSHPLAGSERQGFEHADADLFQDRVTVVTPVESTPPEELSRLKRFWESLGSVVVERSPEEHDESVAQISHCPHVVASALALTLSETNHALAATGFRDATRIAAGDPELWVPILLSNADEIVGCLDRHQAALGAFRDALGRRDTEELKNLLRDAKTKREQLG